MDAFPSFHALARTPPQAPGLQAFLEAAAHGPILWAAQADGHIAICSGHQPATSARANIDVLFEAALRERFCLAACAAAEREWHSTGGPLLVLPARTVLRATACAESVESFYLGQMTALQFEFSAELGGKRFLQVLQSHGLQGADLAVELRTKLDADMALFFLGELRPEPGLPAAHLRRLLAQRVH